MKPLVELMVITTTIITVTLGRAAATSQHFKNALLTIIDAKIEN